MTVRDVFLKVHRWSGLAIAFFLMVAGFTGAILAYQHELERALLASWMTVMPRGQPLSPPELARIAEKLEPLAAVSVIKLDRAVNAAAEVSLEARLDPATGRPYELPFNQVFLDPYSGAVLGRRLWGKIGFDAPHLLPMVSRLHYSLLLGDWGVRLFGIAALLWCLNCFVGFYLTLPVRSKRFFKGWKFSWLVRSTQSIWRLSFEIHRAAGLWIWGLLLVFALSAVQFNLNAQVFQPLLGSILPFQDPQANLPVRSSVDREPALEWAEALERGRRLMSQRAQRQGFVVAEETFLMVSRNLGAYIYAVKSSLDVSDKGGQTRVYFSSSDGGELAFHYPSIASGNMVSAWLSVLHMGHVWGRPYQVCIALMGVIVAILSITGVMMWFKRKHPRRPVLPAVT